MKRIRKPQSLKQKQSCMRNFDIFRLKGMLVSIQGIESRTKQTAPFTAAKLSIKEIIRSLKNVSN